ncbi:bifunctional folylpolyglutamate synthase/dihydrofolate synthase [Ichthyobacterium seriolicida]|uniref:Dihydrofolate synthase/folylpolyglutamate synthase n=1 Tax=Ichthyobacterium seriolicida TaxID=242600 RepID=A0A1J1E2W2_9FLAO|nr:folylpolyglutamate synthase/dihydrofolate synthase family protein [Ichthyobacterium seriolicida]BAV94364.1 dihydrofolate synthase [Ichthyobacterium seriolicida]
MNEIEYKEVLDWVFNQLPVYQTDGIKAYSKIDLRNIISITSTLNNPQENFKSIHVGGTNGKGSCCHMLSSILQECGYKVGLYTSPHLRDFRERIKINGIMIPKDYVMSFILKNKVTFKKYNASFFEMTVAMAFQYFSDQKVDIAVIEVGMGGRLDSTNIVNPLVSVITNIGIDHTHYLGNSIAEIAWEKAGIIKPHTPIVIGQTQEDIRDVFIKKSTEEKAPIYFADQSKSDTIDYTSDLKGHYQVHNKKTVLQTVEILKKHFNIDTNSVKRGLSNVIRNTGFMGRWQIMSDSPITYCDTAHNLDGLSLVLKQIDAERNKKAKLHFILGFVEDKDIVPIVELFPKDASYSFTQANINRALDSKVLQGKFMEKGISGNVYKDVRTAYEYVKNIADKDDFIYIGGSTFIVSEII